MAEADASEYDALVLPGGVANPDQLRMDERAVSFARGFFEQGKPVGVICHGPWPSLRTDIRNAGGEWVDEEVVTDNGLVSSRRPDDLPAFNAKIVEEFAEGRHEQQRTQTVGAQS